MRPSHLSILKANKGERVALQHLDTKIADRLLTLFEVGRLTTDTILKLKYLRTSSRPITEYLDRAMDGISDVWAGRDAMVDGYFWPPNSQVESGEHVIAYMVSRLRAKGVSVVPVVGYDRWSDQTYRLGMKSIPPQADGRYCLRLDTTAVEDADDPEHFLEIITDIVDDLEIDPAQCFVLLDFGDISVSAKSIDFLIAKSMSMIDMLRQFGFDYYVVAGCSLPSSINHAVDAHDSVGAVPRKEMLVWQALRATLTGDRIVSGDYGIRGPSTIEAPSKYINGKIRHTISKQFFIVRGHPIVNDGSYIQMRGLSQDLVGSAHFLGDQFSWGDREILQRSIQGAYGNATSWISIDTNHHLTFVVQEVEEFERALVVRSNTETQLV